MTLTRPFTRPFTLGAVAYDPKVVTIWEGFKDWFGAHDFAFDYVLFSGYEAQAEAHLAGQVDVTWDSPLAWVRTRRLAAAAGRAAHAFRNGRIVVMPSRRARSPRRWATITRTATRRFTTPWCGWPSRGRCATHWSTDKATSAHRVTTRRPP